MKNLNKILLLFLFLMLIAFYAIWETLQSTWVAGRISRYATQYAKEVLNTDIQFNSMNFRLFPPGAELKDVVVISEIEKNNVNFEASALGVYFNPFDIFNTTFQIDAIDVVDAKIQVDLNKSNAGKSKEINFSRREFKEILKKVPVNKFSANNLLATAKDIEVFFNEIELKKDLAKINFKIETENIKLNQFIKQNLSIDSIALKGEVDNQVIKIKDGLIKKDLASASVKGRVKDFLNDSLSFKASSVAKLPLESLHEYLEFEKIGKINNGEAVAKLKFDGDLKSYNVTADIEGANVKSDFAYGEKLNLGFTIDEKTINVTELKIRDKKQKLDLKEPFEFYNFMTNKWVEEPIRISTSKLKTDNFLRYLRESLSLIDGELSGDIKFVLGESFYSFDVENEVTLDTFKLVPGGTQIIKLQDFKLQDGIFRVEDGLFTMNMLLSKGITKLQLVGRIGKDDFSIKMPKGKIDLSEISPIVNFPIDGIGELGFEIYRSELGDTEMKMDLGAENFMFDKYPTDEIEGELKFVFAKNKIDLKNIQGKIGQTSIFANGELNYKDLDLDINYKINSLSLNELKLILTKYPAIQKIPSNLFYGNLDSNGRVYGGIAKDKIKLSGSASGKNNYIFNESIDSFKLSYKMEDGILEGRELSLKKATGRIDSSFKYEIDKNQFDIQSRILSVPLVELGYYANTPLNLVGNLNGEVKTQWSEKGLSSSGALSLSRSSVLSEPYANSSVEFDLKGDNLKSKINLFAGEVFVESEINVSDSKKKSKMNIELDIPNFKSIIGLFKGVDIFSQDILGEIKYSANAEFDWKNVRFESFDSNLKYFKFKKGPIDVFYSNSSPEISVANGQIEKWNMNVRGKKFYLISKGDGNFRNYFDLVTNLKIDASIVEVFNSIITKANGNLRARLDYSDSILGEKYEAYVTSNDLSVSTSFLPTSISNTNMRLSLVDNQLNIDNFKSQISNGFFTLDGGINFSNIVPDINLRYAFKDAGISIMKKSNLVFSGNGSVIGKTFPYTLGGDIYIQKLIFVNEFADFSGGDSAKLFEDVKYLPSQKITRRDNLLDINLNIITRDPVFIKNSMADIGFSGAIQVLGSEKEPRLNGKVSLASRNNKINFKNNEFVLSKGNIFFYEKNKLTNPEVDFKASSNINEHKINVEVIGPVKKIDFNLTSEPALSQSDILSLVAFGYTDDISNNLSDAEKESMTRASVGSLIFDSFKINETLKNEFGLQVNLGTEINRQERSYLSQRGTDNGNQTTGVTSATTFELRKQLSDAMSLSVSSTVGDSVSQRQSVNLNYNVDKKVSIEGVYESNTTDDAQTINDPNSFGADLKMRWSFK